MGSGGRTESVAPLGSVSRGEGEGHGCHGETGLGDIVIGKTVWYCLIRLSICPVMTKQDAPSLARGEHPQRVLYTTVALQSCNPTKKQTVQSEGETKSASFLNSSGGNQKAKRYTSIS